MSMQCQHAVHGDALRQCHLRPSQVVLLLRGIVQGQGSAQLARELSLSQTPVHEIRQQLQQQAQAQNPQTPLPDS